MPRARLKQKTEKCFDNRRCPAILGTAKQEIGAMAKKKVAKKKVAKKKVAKKTCKKSRCCK